MQGYFTFRSKRRGGIYDQVVGRKSISGFGKGNTIYGISDPSLSCFDTFARHGSFDETAYALSSRLRVLPMMHVMHMTAA